MPVTRYAQIYFHCKKLTIFNCFRSFIISIGCPSQRRPKRQLVVTGDSARIQDKTTESSAWFVSVLGVLHRHTGLRFNFSSERQLVIVRLNSPGIKTTSSSFQVECSTGWLRVTMFSFPLSFKGILVKSSGIMP